MSEPRPWLDRLAATVALREIIVLTNQAPTLTDAQLANRLLTLAADSCAPCVPQSSAATR